MDIDSPPHSPGSDHSDAVNTASAKVYFGPLHSPEKKFAPILSPAVLRHNQAFNFTAPGPSQLRRSDRLSSSPQRELEDTLERDEDSDDSPERAADSWDNTPMRSILRRDGEFHIFMLCMLPHWRLCRTVLRHREPHYARTRQSLASAEGITYQHNTASNIQTRERTYIPIHRRLRR